MSFIGIMLRAYGRLGATSRGNSVMCIVYKQFAENLPAALDNQGCTDDTIQTISFDIIGKNSYMQALSQLYHGMQDMQQV
jgi:hypothetical protein